MLRFLDADPDRYAVCFTANTSAAIKLVAESYPFGPSATLVLAVDNHNSVNGIREYARRAGAHVAYLPLDAELRLDDPSRRLASLTSSTRFRRGARLSRSRRSRTSPACSIRCTLIHDAQRLGFDVLLDAAAFAPSNSLSLREWPADFVALSFYKIFGYPTGIGALIVASRHARDAPAAVVRRRHGGLRVGAERHASAARLRRGIRGRNAGLSRASRRCPPASR